MKVTITDIAKDTGLSLSTISKYLNHKNVLPENKAVIEASIKRLGYTPNRIAQSLRSKASHTVAFLMPSLLDDFWGNIMTHIETALRKDGYRSIIYYYSTETLQQIKLANTLINNKVDGVIAVSSYYINKALPLLCDNQIPVVLIDQLEESLKTDFVTSDNYRGGYMAGQYLASHGHRRIGFVAGYSHGYTQKERTRGFLDALKDAGLPFYPEYYSYLTEVEENKTKQTEQLLQLTTPPTAICYFSNSLCLKGIQTLQEADVRTPDDISVMGFDDSIIFSTIDPAITVICQDFHAIGTKTADLILERIRGDMTDFPARIFTPVKLIERESVKFLP